MSAITAKASRKMKKYAVLTREPRCFLGSFDFSWEQRKAKEICSIGTGKSNTQDQVDDGKYPFYIRSDVPVRSNKYLYDCEAVITIGDGNIGKVFHYVNGKFDLHQRCYKMTDFKDIWGKYFFYYFSTKFYDRAMKMTAKATVDSVRLEMISEMDIKKPPQISEQKQIAEFFANLDNLITLHQRKCANLCSPSQVVFSLLFATSTFSWEQRKFSDITFPAGEKNKDNLPLESYSITNEHGFVPQDEKFENGGTMREADKRMYYIVSPNSFAYNPARINVGSIGYQNIGKNVIVSSLYEVFKTSEDVDDRLLWHWFKSPDFQKLIMQLQEGGVRLYFYYDKLCMGEVSLPSLEEQRKIGKLFDTLDNLITLHQRECISFTGRADKLILTANKKRTTSSWEQRKLGDIGKARSGVGFPDADQGGVTGVPFFKVSDMNLDGNENEMIVANNYVTAEQIADHRWSPITELPAIFFAKVGAAVMLNRKRLCRFPFLLDNNTMAYSLTPTKWDADFAKALFGTVDLTSLVQVGALPSYNAGDVESMGIYLPSLFEQEQIGAFFKLLDNLITLHQRKPFLMKWRTSDANRNQTNRLVL